jgi:hypothetical protein
MVWLSTFILHLILVIKLSKYFTNEKEKQINKLGGKGEKEKEYG